MLSAEAMAELRDREEEQKAIRLRDLIDALSGEAFDALLAQLEREAGAARE
jgi:hypothetical protein